MGALQPRLPRWRIAGRLERSSQHFPLSKGSFGLLDLLQASVSVERQLSTRTQLTLEAHTVRGLHLFSLDRGWDCKRIVVRAVAGKDESDSSTSRGPAVWQNQVISAVQKSGNHNTKEAGHLEVDAVLGSSLEKMSRYRSALMRDFYRGIEMLRVLQAERRKRERGG